MQDAKFLPAWVAAVFTALLMQPEGLEHFRICSKQQLGRLAVLLQQVDLPDVESSNLLTHLPGCIDFIIKALAGSGKVLVHCAAGVSRSTTVREAPPLRCCVHSCCVLLPHAVDAWMTIASAAS